MSKINFKVTGRIKKTGSGSLVDFIANGEIERDGELIPCEVGYYDMATGLIPAFIYIQDGITENGNHHNKETIKLDY